MPSVRARSTENPWVTSRPRTRMEPASGVVVPPSTRMSVLFPAPLWPTIPTISPMPTRSWASARARVSLYRLVIPVRLTNGGWDAPSWPNAGCSALGRLPWERDRRQGLVMEVGVDELPGPGQAVLRCGDAVSRGRVHPRVEILLGDLQQRHLDHLGHRRTLQHLVRDPEGDRRDTGRRRDGDS